jgi:hypothetical protein
LQALLELAWHGKDGGKEMAQVRDVRETHINEKSKN